MNDSRDIGYKAEDILLIQNSVKMIEVDATGRYITKPGNLKAIVRTLRETMDKLREIQSEEALFCPPGADGYTHKTCACIPPMDPGIPLSDWYRR